MRVSRDSILLGGLWRMGACESNGEGDVRGHLALDCMGKVVIDVTLCYSA